MTAPEPEDEQLGLKEFATTIAKLDVDDIPTDLLKSLIAESRLRTKAALIEQLENEPLNSIPTMSRSDAVKFAIVMEEGVFFENSIQLQAQSILAESRHNSILFDKDCQDVPDDDETGLNDSQQKSLFAAEVGNISNVFNESFRSRFKETKSYWGEQVPDKSKNRILDSLIDNFDEPSNLQDGKLDFLNSNDVPAHSPAVNRTRNVFDLSDVPMSSPNSERGQSNSMTTERNSRPAKVDFMSMTSIFDTNDEPDLILDDKSIFDKSLLFGTNGNSNIFETENKSKVPLSGNSFLPKSPAVKESILKSPQSYLDKVTTSQLQSHSESFFTKAKTSPKVKFALDVKYNSGKESSILSKDESLWKGDSLFDASLSKVLNKSAYSADGYGGEQSVLQKSDSPLKFERNSILSQLNSQSQSIKLKESNEVDDYPVQMPLTDQVLSYTPEKKKVESPAKGSSIPRPKLSSDGRRISISPFAATVSSPLNPDAKSSPGGLVAADSQLARMQSPTDQTKQVQKLRQSLDQLEDSHAKLKTKHCELEQELKSQRKENQDLRARENETEQEIYNQQVRVSELENKLQISANENNNLSKLLTSNQEELSSLNRELNDCKLSHKKEVESLRSKLEAVESQSQVSQEHIVHIENQLLKSDRENQSLMETLDRLKVELATALDRKRELEAYLEKNEEQAMNQMEFMPKTSMDCSVQTETAIFISTNAQTCSEEFQSHMHAQTESKQTVNRDTLTEIARLANSVTQTPIIATVSTETNTREVLFRTTGTQSHSQLLTCDALIQTDILPDLNEIDISCVQMPEEDNQMFNQLQSYESAKNQLKKELNSVGDGVMTLRRKLDQRVHYDQEIERWIQKLKSDVKNVEENVVDVKNSLQSEYAKSLRLKESVKRLIQNRGLKAKLEITVDSQSQTDLEQTEAASQTLEIASPKESKKQPVYYYYVFGLVLIGIFCLTKYAREIEVLEPEYVLI